MMNMYILTLLLSVQLLQASDDLILRSAYPVWDPVPVISKAAGERLVLTPFIASGDLEDARKQSLVELDGISDQIPSYSGFLTVDEGFNSNMFFWYFPAQDKNPNAPVILWLQGGPGASSLFGLFEEIGPFSVTKEADGNYSVVENMYTWNKNYSLIFIDNPVGTGFSYTDEGGYAKNQTIIAEHLHLALVQIFTIYKELKEAPFFIAGESYAGKYLPALAYTIHRKNPTADLRINLKGIAVGNGLTDPKSMLDYSQYLYQLGLIDTQTRDDIARLEAWCRKLIAYENTYDAFHAWSLLLRLFQNKANYTNLYNYLDNTDASAFSRPFYEFVQSLNIRRILHVGDAEFTSVGKVYEILRPDIMKSVKRELEEVMDNYRVLYYSGQLDIIVAYPLSVNMFKQLKSNKSSEYAKAQRRAWFVDNELAGYMKSAGRFTEVLVRNAGHMVPMDQAKWALDLINRFVTDNLGPE